MREDGLNDRYQRANTGLTTRRRSTGFFADCGIIRRARTRATKSVLAAPFFGCVIESAVMELGMVLATVAAVLVALFAACVNLWLYRTQTDPEVIVFATPDEVEEALIWIVVQNIGKGLATDVKFIWRNIPPMKSPGLTPEEAMANPPTPFVGPLLKASHHSAPDPVEFSSGGSMRV